MSDFIDIGAVDDIPRQAARLVKTHFGCIAVFRTAEDKIFALEDRCPHKNGPLSQGIQHGDSITCPLHNWVFDLNTGKAQGADVGQVRTFGLRVEGGRILLDNASVQSPVAAE